MPSIELAELGLHARRRNTKKSSYNHVPNQDFVAQVRLSSRSGPDANNPKAECGASEESLSFGSNLTKPTPFCYSSQEEVGKTWPQWPLMPTDDTQENIMLQDLVQQEMSCIQDVFEVDDPGDDCDSTLLLAGQSRNKHRDRREFNRYRYRKRKLQKYYQSARSVFLAQWRDMGGLFSTSRRYKGINQTFVRYDQIPQPLITSYISEEQFWTSLKRFFGLLPPPTVSTGHFPNSDQIKYIKNYLRSKPTPTHSSDAEDGGRDLVRICAKLTEFIFCNRESKIIFLGDNRAMYHRPRNPTWEIFQGFGLVEQFHHDAVSNQPSVLGQDPWHLARNASLSKRHSIMRVWAALRYLLAEERQVKGSDPDSIMKCGLLRIYDTLSTFNVNLHGRPGIDFSRFSDKLVES
ncbi:hypothetical protein N7448_011397 [Penicillium atrosanguineum]|nr:hypothetical protein N7448_011397 [Penicillium atrosanguineum]